MYYIYCPPYSVVRFTLIERGDDSNEVGIAAGWLRKFGRSIGIPIYWGWNDKNEVIYDAHVPITSNANWVKEVIEYEGLFKDVKVIAHEEVI